MEESDIVRAQYMEQKKEEERRRLEEKRIQKEAMIQATKAKDAEI
jgi:hypothetical protein